MTHWLLHNLIRLDKKSLFFIVFLSCTLISADTYSQSEFEITGRVFNFANNKPLELATIFIEETKQWTVTDNQGFFKIAFTKSGDYTFTISYNGYQTLKRNITVDKSTILNFKLKELSLSLEEVVVIAEKKKLVTSSKIAQTAIKHLQPRSLSDILQLVPGNVTENPSLSKPKQLKIRDISTDANSALGTSLIVDGAPLSTNANLQVFSTAKSGRGNNAPTVAGRGVDLRDITTENIESIEVIRGIPSVKYGDLTSGAVIVTTKSGKSPLEVKTSIDPNAKLFYVGKGFLLPKEQGTIFSSLDFAQAYPDKRKKFIGYERITGTIGYANTLFKNTNPLSINAKLAYFKTLDDFKSDEQINSKEIINSGKSGIRFSLRGKWNTNSKFIDNVSYLFSANYTHQKDYIKDLKTITAGTMPVATSYLEGENVAEFLPAEYYAESTIDGKPFTIFSQLTASKHFAIGKSNNTFNLGLEWSSQGNNGAGMTFDLNRPPTINSVSTLRPRGFKDIPNLNRYTAFIENQFNVNIKKTKLTINAGVRATHIPLSKQLYKKGLTTIEPRINSNYQVLNSKNNSIFNNLSLRFGYGIAYKSPTLLHLYPNKAYFDESSFNYYDGDKGSLAVLTTKIIDDTSNRNLKPLKNTKKEIGIDVSVDKIKASLTAYSEKQINGFDFSSVPVFLEHKNYIVNGSGKRPFLRPDGVYYYEGNTIVKANQELETVFRFYNRPVNNFTFEKKGLEYNINFGKIDVLKTSVVVDGAWFFTKQKSTLQHYNSISTPYNGKAFPYIAVMPAGRTNLRQRLNTNLRLITHIPSIKMIVSLVTQVVWFNKQQTKYEDENGNPLVFVTENDKKIKVDNVYDYRGTNVAKKIAPVGYIDRAGNYYNFDVANFRTQPFYTMVGTYYDKYFLEESLPSAVQFNLKVTKELSNTLDISFTANNFLNMRPYQRLKRSSGYIKRNTPLYFGAEIKFKL